jgi:hypothetical protein
VIGSAVTFISYLWHYLVARMLYDQVLRPLIHGHARGALLLCGVAIGSFALGRWNGRRGSVRADRLSRRRSA